MKITFRGWNREVYPHHHTAAPVRSEAGRYRSRKSGEPLEWESGTSVVAKLSKLTLTGDFLVEMEFEPAELRSWLAQHLKSDPEAAARLLGEMQGEVMVALASRAKEDAVAGLARESAET